MTSEQAPNAGLPRHIAVIMDGNGRWARRRLLPRSAGHKVGADALKSLVRGCLQHGVACLTVFAFSSENWKRPPDEVSTLMHLLLQMLQRETSVLAAQRVRLRFIGDRSALAAELREQMQRAEQLTTDCDALQLNIALNYGGRWDLVQAARALQDDAVPIDADSLASRLCLADLPEPDLFIRTGGERRISNFLLWQLAYTELYFTDVLWPDFGEAELQQALEDFASRERRFGAVGTRI